MWPLLLAIWISCPFPSRLAGSSSTTHTVCPLPSATGASCTITIMTVSPWLAMDSWGRGVVGVCFILVVFRVVRLRSLVGGPLGMLWLFSVDMEGVVDWFVGVFYRYSCSASWAFVLTWVSFQRNAGAINRLRVCFEEESFLYVGDGPPCSSSQFLRIQRRGNTDSELVRSIPGKPPVYCQWHAGATDGGVG